jgi:hypothetical protein
VSYIAPACDFCASKSRSCTSPVCPAQQTSVREIRSINVRNRSESLQRAHLAQFLQRGQCLQWSVGQQNPFVKSRRCLPIVQRKTFDIWGV